MPKCPKCNAEIDHLDAVTTERTIYVVSLPTSEQEKQDQGYDVGTGLIWVMNKVCPVSDSYTCPVCGREIAQDDEEVAKILKGDE